MLAKQRERNSQLALQETKVREGLMNVDRANDLRAGQDDTSILGNIPKPSHMAKSGAIAIIGVTLIKIAFGITVFSINKNLEETIPNVNAKTNPKSKPKRASITV